MATGRTAGAGLLTEKDEKILKLAFKISNTLKDCLVNDHKNNFNDEYGKISRTRDAGTGQGGGKLQRDALTTRGRQGKAPYSNRNLRWHPLILSYNKPNYASEIDNIRIEGNNPYTLIFQIDGTEYRPEEVYKLSEPHVALPEHWEPHIDTLKKFTDSDWTANSCLIPAQEYSPWYYSIQSYVVLGIAVVTNLYQIADDSYIKKIIEILRSQDIDSSLNLLDKNFNLLLEDIEEISKCPLCLRYLKEKPAGLPGSNREKTFQPPWRPTKREEGNEESIQLLHTKPLIESEIRHKPEYVRYGHRWCNISMTDHSIDETLDFMEQILKAHNKCK